uniref:Trinucleotide repeat containing adaptor 6B n=1 Tax=Rousettus aegyptiacus TaxID=9407 RepID=A0A7J8JN28_ROUAE|nr:trinucleotide repeat containing adaptor 6B [Rousettus aegyptiacus]
MSHLPLSISPCPTICPSIPQVSFMRILFASILISSREKEQEREEQLMEDKKRKKEDKKKKEATQKVTEQKTKVPEVTKPSLSQPTAASPIGSSPSPPVNGGNNAKRVAVPNGQPPSAARYMPREVPPRFRCQQDHKVLLKRGQPPPPSCMLLGGGAGPPPSTPPGANPNNAQVTGTLLQSESGTAPESTLGGAAASNYANSTWGPGASSNNGTSPNPTHIWEKVIVDESNMEEWPCIASKDTESSSENTTDNNSASNPGSEKSTLPGSTTSNKGKGGQCQSASSGNECNLGVWKSDPKAKSVQSSNSTPESNNGLGNWRNVSGQDRIGSGSGFSNFNPNSNPSAWPALVQEGNSRKGALETDTSNSSAQVSTVGQASREQQSKMENAGVNFVVSGREQAQIHNTDGPKNGNTNSLNLSSPNPMENKGMPFGMGLGNASRSTDAPSQSTGDRKTGSVGSWGAARGPSGTDTASGQSNSGNNGNNGKDREDSWKGASVQKSTGSKNDSWDNNNRSTGGSWNFGPQDSNLDNMVPNTLNVGLPDLQTKGPIPGYGSGFSSGGMDYGMVGGKEAGTESRFKQWTSMIEGLPSVATQEANMHKNGAIVAPGKTRGGSPYNQFDIIPGDTLGGHTGPAGDSWLPAKSPPTNKIGSKSSNASWPPEFQPGVPWKGIQNIDPESDPYVTPGSVLGGTATSPIVDTDHQLLRDNTTGSNSSLNTSLPSPGAWPYSASDNSFTTVHSTSVKFPDYKSTWSPDPIGHNPTHLSNKMWKNHISSRNTTPLPRPPPGLTNPKPSSPWSSTAPRSVRGWGTQDSRLASASTWSDGGSVRPSYWLVLHNLTPQIDGSTLRTICMQHGPLLTFHLNLTQGTALIRYSTKQEAAKAQTALHMCVLGNTTILAEFATDDEVSRFLAQAQPPTPAATPSAPAAGWQSLETGQTQSDPVGPALNLFGGSTGLGQWSSSAGGSSGADLAGASLWGPPNYSSSLWGVPTVEDPHRMGSPAPLLPGDLLGGGSDSI